MSDNANISNEGGGFGHIATEGLDTTHGVVLYLDDISVSFDGF
jgi:urea transport system ATP-binding protein